MSYGGVPYAGGAFGGQAVPPGSNDALPHLAVEVAFTTDALATPAWVDITGDVRDWDTSRGRNRELERFQPGRATIVLDNRDRRYDSSHATGPWFGNLKPMRRVRIRETFNGVTFPVFDGFVDKWQLDYPQYGKDATATIVATDAFKIFARTDLGRSVYTNEVEADAPSYWWRLNEGSAEGPQEGVALNSGTLGSTGDGTYTGGVDPGAQSLIVHDPGTSLSQTSDTVTPGIPISGVDLPSSLSFLERFNDGLAFTIEFWARPQEEALATYAIFQRATSPSTSLFYILWFTDPGNIGQFLLNVGAESIETGNGTAPPGSIYHVVAKFVPSGSDMVVSLWLNGVQMATNTFTGTPNEGTVNVNAIGHSGDANNNWTGRISDVAVYLSDLSDTRIAAHNTAGRAPWNGDLPGARAGRVLDLADWPDSLRELDVGATAFQSANITGQTVLEHLQKTGETEFGLLYVDRAGNVRLVSRSAVFARTVAAGATFGDGAGEIAYRDIKFDDGDEVIRNRATITQLNGVPAVEEDTASVTEFGRFDYELSGLYHDSLTHSEDYAEFIVAEYKDPRRRVVSLTLGPAQLGAEADLYPQMLGRELGDAIVVKNRPPGGGDAFSQTCVIEGIRHQQVPGPGGGTRGHLTTTWILSPEFSNEF